MNKIRQILLSLIYAVFIIVFCFTLVDNVTNVWNIIFLSLMLFVSFTFRNFYLHNEAKPKVYALSLFIDIILIFIITLIDKGSMSFLYYIVIIIEVSMIYNAKVSILTTMLQFCFYIVDIVIKESYKVQFIIPKLFLHSLIFIGTCIAMYIINYFIRQSEFIEKVLNDLTIKNLEQENLYAELKIAYEKAEETAMLKERTRIAREIHDTVGHNLTTAIVELEAGRMLGEKDMTTAMKKFEMARIQVGKCLDEIRKSVRMLEDKNDLEDLNTALNMLIEEVKINTGVNIIHNIAKADGLKYEIKKLIYRTLQEGITNGIKHGKSTAFVFNLNYDNGKVEFLLENNGAGCENINYGFGLRSMISRVKENGGEIEISSEAENGFGIYMTVPV